MELHHCTNLVNGLELNGPVAIFNVDQCTLQFTPWIVQWLQSLSLNVYDVALAHGTFDRRFIGLILGSARVLSLFELRKTLKRSLLIFTAFVFASSLGFANFEVDFDLGVANTALSTILNQLAWLVFLFTHIFALFLLFTLLQVAQLLRLCGN